jgi:hypothetical protein
MPGKAKKNGSSRDDHVVEGYDLRDLSWRRPWGMSNASFNKQLVPLLREKLLRKIGM